MDRSIFLFAASNPFVVSIIVKRVASYVLPSIKPNSNIPEADFPASTINSDIVDSSFCASLVSSVNSISGTLCCPPTNFVVAPVFKASFNFRSIGAISALIKSSDSLDKPKLLTSSFTSVCADSSRRESTITCICSFANPCALRFNAKLVNTNLASSLLALRSCSIVDLNSFWNAGSAFNASLCDLTGAATISLFLRSNGSLLGTTPKKSPRTCVCFVVVAIASARPSTAKR